MTLGQNARDTSSTERWVILLDVLAVLTPVVVCLFIVLGDIPIRLIVYYERSGIDHEGPCYALVEPLGFKVATATLAITCVLAVVRMLLSQARWYVPALALGISLAAYLLIVNMFRFG